MRYFTGKRDPKQTARDAIVALREQLMMIEKREEYLQRQIAQDIAKAKANVVSNKSGTSSHHPISHGDRTCFTGRGVPRGFTFFSSPLVDLG
jgi:hypothetical protein